MTKYSSLGMLIDMAINNAETANQQLQKLMRQCQEAQLQLSLLKDYRQDYAVRLQKSAEIGMSASNYHNFRQFIATLDQAILQQNKVVAQIEAKLQNGRKHWYEEKRRVSSYETLLARQTRQQQVRDNRNEQLASDEFSANRFRRAGQLL